MRVAAIAGMLAALGATFAARSACADPPAQQAAVARARKLGLARSAQWRRLLLYKARTGGLWASQVDGKEYFLAAGGKSDPNAELEATLAAFFVPMSPGEEDRHPLCRFPARRQWLEARLHFEADLMQPPVCPALARYVDEMDAESVSFVYASNYIESPASAFGHTFLRIKKRAPHGPSRALAEPGADQRDHGVDFTATTDTNNFLLYAAKGLGGLFPGTFRFRPYDVMLRDYAATEARDLWEYDLALRPVEVEALVLRLWELALTRIDYYYLTENCTYQIVAAIDAANPRVDLVDRLRFVVLPIDAVKAVEATPGLVTRITYRPSVRSLFRAAVSSLDSDRQALVARLLDDVEAPMPVDLAPDEAARVLDAAKLGIDARHASSMLDGKNPQAVKARRRLVERRARITTAPVSTPPPRAPEAKEPHRSHGSMRVMLGTGMTSQYDTGFAALGYRIALHDLADPPDGEPELTQLQFFDTRLRYDYARRVLTVDGVTFAEALALKPLSRFEKHVSWRIRAFGMRLHDRACSDCFAHGANVALGAAMATRNEHAVIFLMASSFAVLSSGVDGIGGSIVRAGVGPFGGVRLRLPASTVGLVTGTVSYLPFQDLAGTFDVHAVLRTRLATNVAIGVEGSAQPRALEAQLASYVYF